MEKITVMHRVISVYGRKIFSVTLIFNSLLSVACVVGILSGFYAAYPFWRPFEPHVFDGNLFWLVVAAAIINIFPAAHLGKVHTGRLWFHHYFYGFAVMFSSILWLFFFTSVSLLSVFFIYTTSLDVNVGRFFFLGGLTLVLDDLPDVSRITMNGLSWLKRRACQMRNVLHITQLFLGLATGYFFVALSMHIAQIPEARTPANFILIGTLFVTTFTSFGNFRRKIWLRIKPEPEAHRHH